MGIVNVFLTSLGGKKITPNMVKVHPLLQSNVKTLQLEHNFFSLAAAFWGFFLFNVVYS